MRHLSELARHANLIWSFTQRDIRARYKQTIFGVAWAIVQPLSLMLIFTLVFSRFARVPSDGIPYPLFAYSALIFWNFFVTSLLQGTIAMTANGNLVRKIYFPKETLLLAVLLSAALDLAIAFAIFVGLFVYYQVAVTWAVLWTIPLLAIQVMLTLGVICITSSVHVYFRDIGHALPLGLQLWMFATPVAYPVSLVPESLRPLYMLNPMTPIVDGYRRVLVSGHPPVVADLVPVIVIALALMSLGYLGFKRAERTFADVI